MPDLQNRELLSPVSAMVLSLMPVIGEHLSTLKLDRNSVSSLNELFARYYQAHFHKALRLRGLDVLEQFYT